MINSSEKLNEKIYEVTIGVESSFETQSPNLLKQLLSLGRKGKGTTNYLQSAKYTFWNFIPLNLFYQFRRYYNIYFLAAAVFALIPGISPLNPYVSVVPLVFVVGVTALKDGIEDYLRHREDKKSNNKEYYVLRGRQGFAGNMKSKDILPGDIVFVPKGEKFPADLILLHSTDEEGYAFVETAELDGETNLKRKSIIDDYLAEEYNTVEASIKLKMMIQCDLPNEKLHSFGKGRLLLYNEKTNEIEAKTEVERVCPMKYDNLLLRGSKLRNTEKISGIVLYVGQDTRMARNLKNSPLKYSTLEGKINKLVATIFLVNGLILTVSIVLGAVFFSVAEDTAFYLQLTDIATKAAENAAAYYVLYTYLIPISLFVTIEFVRIVQALFMRVDEEMISHRLDEDGNVTELHMTPRNSNLNEDLGAINYIFSDKTGTLTQNIMRMSRWWIHGATQDFLCNEQDFPGSLAKQYADCNQTDDEYMLAEYVKALLICHSVIPVMDKNKQEIALEGPSPEEIAILKGLHANGVKILPRQKTTIKAEYEDSFGNTGNISFEVVKVIEFSSERKKMSVIIKESEDKYTLYCKGADAIISNNLCDETSQETLEKLHYNIHMFSSLGLRCLVIAKKTLTRAQFENFEKSFEKSIADISAQRRVRQETTNNMVETDLELLGIIAVEDKLQDNVAKSIQFILDAGIKLWVLTGDKMETAINIGFSSALLNETMAISEISCKTPESTLKRIQEILAQQNGPNSAVVIDGDSLEFVLAKYHNEFLELVLSCKSVLCCRVSPLQKALVVDLVRVHKPSAITLAIGDGANDVSMIQKAHVGVGIAGREGGQATRASDYAIGEFQILVRLMAVHGRYSYMRLSKLILYSFYKNISLIMVQFWYGIYSAWSAQSIYEGLFLTLYNVIFTSIGPLILACFEQDAQQNMLLKYPQMYRAVSKGLYFNIPAITKAFFFSLYNSLVIFFFFYGLASKFDIMNANGRPGGLVLNQYLMAGLVYITVMFRLFIFTRHWVWLTFVGHMVNFVLFVGCTFAFQHITNSASVDTQIALQLHQMGSYYFMLLLVAVTCSIPEFMLKYYRKQFHPNDADILMEQSKMASTKKEMYD